MKPSYWGTCSGLLRYMLVVKVGGDERPPAKVILQCLFFSW